MIRDVNEIKKEMFEIKDLPRENNRCTDRSVEINEYNERSRREFNKDLLEMEWYFWPTSG